MFKFEQSQGEQKYSMSDGTQFVIPKIYESKVREKQF